MYFLNKLSFNVLQKMHEMFYYAYIEKVLAFCLICRFGNVTEAQKKTVRKTITVASKLLGTMLPSVECIYRDRVMNKANIIVGDTRHPLAYSFVLLPSERRYCLLLLTKNKSKFSFVPQA